MKCIWLASIVSLLVVSASARAGQRMDYEIYASGIDAVSAQLVIEDPAPGRYHMHMKAQTRGFLSKLVPWSGSFDTVGWRVGDALHPQLHRSIATWRQQEDRSTYRYARDGAFEGVEVIENGKDRTPNPLDPALTTDTTDALSASLAVMEKLAATGRCDGSDEVFDGRRRYRIRFRTDGEDMLKASGYNLFEGRATRCIVETVPLAGKWHSKPRGWLSIQEQGRQSGMLPAVWMAPLAKGEAAVPVRMRIKTDYGTLFMHLTGYHHDSPDPAGASKP